MTYETVVLSGVEASGMATVVYLRGPSRVFGQDFGEPLKKSLPP